MTAKELLNKLQKLIKENPKAAHKKVVMDQYDCAEAMSVGYVEAQDVHAWMDRVELS
jgi:hypothetical protein